MADCRSGFIITVPGLILKAVQTTQFAHLVAKSHTHKESDLCYTDSKMWAFYFDTLATLSAQYVTEERERKT